MKIEDIEEVLNMHLLTEIVSTRPLNHEPGDSLMRLRAYGAVSAQYVRPMFEVMRAAVDPLLSPTGLPCAACGDFAYTWNCEAHTYWSPIGDEDDLTMEEETSFRTAFSVGPVMEQIRRAYQVPPALMPHHDATGGLVSMYQEIVLGGAEQPVVPRESVRAYLDGLQDISIDFAITVEGMAALDEALASPDGASR